MAEESDDEGLGPSGFVLATVVHDFEAEHESEMTLKCGEIVRVLDQNVGDGWWEGLHEDIQTRGLFPKDYVQLVSLVPDSEDDCLETEDSDMLPPPPPDLEPSCAETIEEAEEDDEVFPLPDITLSKEMLSAEPPRGEPDSMTRVEPASVAMPSPPPSPAATRTPATAARTAPSSSSATTSATAAPSKSAEEVRTTPRTSRMPSLPTPGKSLDEKTARKLLATGQAPCIVGGPTWFSEVDVPSIRFVATRRESKMNGMKQFVVYDIMSSNENSGQAAMTVSRRYKHFLWLHETLSGLFPGVVIPPLPVKQFTGRFSDQFVYERQVQLERFLNRLARSPLIRVAHAFTHFLTATTFETWKHGKNSVRRSVAYSRSSSSKESPQYFFSLSFPANNVPFDRLLVAENFSLFLGVLERSTANLHTASCGMRGAYEELSSSYEKLGVALKTFASGQNDRKSSITGGALSDGKKSPSLRHKYGVQTSAVTTSSASTMTSPASPGVAAKGSAGAGDAAVSAPSTTKFYSEVDLLSDDTDASSSPPANRVCMGSEGTRRQPAPPPPQRPPPPPAAAAHRTPSDTPPKPSPVPTPRQRKPSGLASPPPPSAAHKEKQQQQRAHKPPPPPPSSSSSSKLNGHHHADSASSKTKEKPVIAATPPSSQNTVAEATPTETTVEYVPSEEVENWSWRKSCTRFPRVMGRLHGVGSGLVKLSQSLAAAEHSDSRTDLSDNIREYTGLIQVLPAISKYHDEGIWQLNAAKAMPASQTQRDAVTQATRHAEICSNVVLSEMDHFYESLLSDLESMTVNFLRKKRDQHQMMADAYSKMLDMVERD